MRVVPAARDYRGVGDDLVADAAAAGATGVQALDVLTHDDVVDARVGVAERRRRAGVQPYRTDAGKEVEPEAKPELRVGPRLPTVGMSRFR